MFICRRTMILTLVITLLIAGPATLETFGQNESPISVLIRTDSNEEAIRAAIQAVGGHITGEYKYLEVIAAQPEGFGEVESLAGHGALKVDSPITMPDTVQPFSGRQQLASSTADFTPAGTGLEDNIPATFMGNIGKKSSVKNFAEDHEGSYLLNHAKSNVRELHEEGYTGKNVIVAVIDSGLRPGFEHLLEDAVIGCEDMLNPSGIPEPHFDDACLADANAGHGTFVAGLIAGNAIFQFDPAGMFLQSVGIHAPAAIFSDDHSDKSEKSGKSGKSSKSKKSGKDNLVAMIGSAPNAKIYALRIFDNEALRGTTEDIVAAIERVLELKNEQGVDIDVVNMSFGRRTFNAGGTFVQLLVDTLLDNDILPVVAAGNSGPSAATTASPASSLESLAVAAGSVPHQERIFADVFFGDLPFAFPGLGSLFRPFDGVQTANFSSRGPNADGRPGPDVITAGFGLFGQGLSDPLQDPANDWVSLAFGTSFSTPLTAGIAAVLRGKFNGRSARQVRNAIIESANADILEDGSTAMDRGRGWVDAEEAFELLEDNEVSDLTPVPATPSIFVNDNLETATGLIVQTGVVTESTGFLLPAQRHEIFYEIPPNTAEVTVRIHNVAAENPPPGQNPFFGDNIRLSTHSAKTSSIVTGDYFDLNAAAGSVAAFLGAGSDRAFVLADNDFSTTSVLCTTPPPGPPPIECVAFDNLEPGVLRITVSGDTLNLGRMSADVTISSSPIGRPGLTADGTVEQGPAIVDLSGFPGQVLDLGNSVVVPVVIPAGPAPFSPLEIRLEWDHDWSRYPSNDLDMFVEVPGFGVVLVAFSLDSPEVIVTFAPPGPLNIIISGFEVNTPDDNWRLRVTVDGVVISGP